MLLRRSIPLTIFFCLSIVASACAEKLALIYPEDKTVVSRSDFLIIKGGDAPPLEEMIIEVNGVASDPLDISTAEYKATFADLLILEPTWTSGKNSVVVQGLVGGKVVATVKAEIYYSSHNDPVAITPPGFQPFVMHTAGKEALCKPCHNMQPSDAQLKNGTAESNPCASCHARMFKQKFVHGPEGVFQCADCHDSKSAPQRWQVTKTELTLCGECHVDKIDDFKKNTFVHGPVAVGGCIVCHDPHASEQPAQLVAPVNTLCLGCHSNVAGRLHVTRGVAGKGHPLDKVRDPANPERQLSCASCHNPHGGASSAFFQGGARSPMTLCQYCHKK